ncbi:hypothetical protein [Nocardia sp. NPDC052566]|uniref:hypothetical protein n=1 Tax=Nocardia sp. NPDC052566 TaxID=3364330 RepID=UPI0037C95B7E
MDRPPVQINAKVPWALAQGAKRAAKLRGLTLNAYLAELIAADLAGITDTLRRQFAEEEQELAAEREAMLAALNRIKP